MGLARRLERRTIQIVLLLVAVVLLIIGGVGFAQPFLSPGGVHDGVIYSRGYQVLRLRTGGVYQTTKIPIVSVRLDDGTTHDVESTELFDLYGRDGPNLHVRVQVDADGSPKRIQYKGKWYGAGPPVWFWIGFGVVFLAGGALLARWSIRRLRRA